jgi:hypothetical protein
MPRRLHCGGSVAARRLHHGRSVAGRRLHCRLHCRLHHQAHRVFPPGSSGVFQAACYAAFPTGVVRGFWPVDIEARLSEEFSRWFAEVTRALVNANL